MGDRHETVLIKSCDMLLGTYISKGMTPEKFLSEEYPVQLLKNPGKFI